MRFVVDITVDRELLKEALDENRYILLLTDIADELIDTFGEFETEDDWWRVDAVSTHAAPKLLRKNGGDYTKPKPLIEVLDEEPLAQPEGGCVD